MASTSTSGSADGQELDNSMTAFDEVNEMLTNLYDDPVDPEDVLAAYDTVVAVYGSERYRGDLDGYVDVVADAVPSRAAYRSTDYDDISDLNDLVEGGDALVVSVDNDGSPRGGRGIPTYEEIASRGFSTEGKWWDNPQMVDADLLLDRTSFYGAVRAPGEATVFAMDTGENQDLFYLFENQV